MHVQSILTIMVSLHQDIIPNRMQQRIAQFQENGQSKIIKDREG